MQFIKVHGGSRYVNMDFVQSFYIKPISITEHASEDLKFVKYNEFQVVASVGGEAICVLAADTIQEAWNYLDYLVSTEDRVIKKG
jgi:hypothetical protein